MRCDICANFKDCETVKEFKETMDKMTMRNEVCNTTRSLQEEIYILIPQYCVYYIEQI